MQEKKQRRKEGSKGTVKINTERKGEVNELAPSNKQFPSSPPVNATHASELG